LRSSSPQRRKGRRGNAEIGEEWKRRKTFSSSLRNLGVHCASVVDWN
jgi:hypothetical protein